MGEVLIIFRVLCGVIYLGIKPTFFAPSGPNTPLPLGVGRPPELITEPPSSTPLFTNSAKFIRFERESYILIKRVPGKSPYGQPKQTFEWSNP